MNEAKQKLIAVAESYIGVRETAPNCGPEVEMFQKAVDGKAGKESWCMCFVQFCVKFVKGELGVSSDLFLSEHCLTVFHKTNLDLYRHSPAPGLIVIWQHGNTANGHTGIVTRLIDADHMETVEGNTGPDDKKVERNGDGVYRKVRHIHPVGEMHIVGYIDPFPD